MSCWQIMLIIILPGLIVAQESVLVVLRLGLTRSRPGADPEHSRRRPGAVVEENYIEYRGVSVLEGSYSESIAKLNRI